MQLPFGVDYTRRGHRKSTSVKGVYRLYVGGGGVILGKIKIFFLVSFEFSFLFTFSPYSNHLGGGVMPTLPPPLHAPGFSVRNQSIVFKDKLSLYLDQKGG